VCNVSIGNNHTFTTESGEKRTNTVFVDLQIWNKLAESFVKKVKKGDQIFVEGHLRQNSWTDKDGKKVSKLVVNVAQWQLVRSKSKAAEAESVAAE
jgi:single-strand DNA-binding protein